MMEYIILVWFTFSQIGSPRNDIYKGNQFWCVNVSTSIAEFTRAWNNLDAESKSRARIFKGKEYKVENALINSQENN